MARSIGTMTPAMDRSKTFPLSLHWIAPVLFLFPGLCSRGTAAGGPVILDDFRSVAGWRTISSEGAHLRLTSGRGKTGNAMVFEFDLRGVKGYVLAEKDFPLDLSGDYEFTFDLRADAPVNNFEFKLIDDHENVFWIKKLNVEYPRDWTKQRIKKGQISFAWGPAPGGELHKVGKIQFGVSTGTGGTGTVLISNFRLEAIDTNEGRDARAEITGLTAATAGRPSIDPAGDSILNWQSSSMGEEDSLIIDFNRRKEIGGLVIDWDSARYAASYDVLISDDGSEWSAAYRVRNGNGGRDYICTSEGEGDFLKLLFHGGGRGKGYRIKRLEIKGAKFSASPNAFFRAVAADATPGRYPMYFRDKQSYWTVVGVGGDPVKALINEQGQVEVAKQQFSLEPFLFVGDRLVTWSNVTTTTSLEDDYLPIPSVRWTYNDLLTLTVQAIGSGDPGSSRLSVCYSLECRQAVNGGKLFVAIRPFQVYPPWQQLNIEGGVSRIDSIAYHGGVVSVNRRQVIPLTTPSAFGAAEFDRGSITDYLSRAKVPEAQEVYDHFGYASAALEYDFSLPAGGKKEVVIDVPLHGDPAPVVRPERVSAYYDSVLAVTAAAWKRKLNNVEIVLPAEANAVANTLRSNLAYILVDRDGPAIQPGSRSYDRSWIRDGSLICSALLRTGHTAEVRDFIDWYAGYQFPDGKIPCVVDSRGRDAVPEHDSNGEFIYAVLDYFRFSHDTVWLRGKFDRVAKTVDYIRSLRSLRKTAMYRDGTPEQRACFGLVPESISHEGYSDAPRHSYWDDFFILRGLKDAVTIASILGERELADGFAAERDDFRKDLYASMRLAMENKKIDYIPGCVELGDFDATSTTIGIAPGGELGSIPEPQLHNTFERYYRYLTRRTGDTAIVNYTPYETRVIGSFVLLGEKQRAAEALNFFMRDRRPSAWNHWAEVVWRDPRAPKYIGDMPHAWVGSDFIRSVLSMFLYERESDGAHVLCAGIPDEWVTSESGVRVGNLPTPFGSLSCALTAKGSTVTARVSGDFDASRHTLVLHSPLPGPLSSVTIDGKHISPPASGDIVIGSLPARIILRY